MANAELYTVAIQRSTMAGTPTDRPDERDDIPAMAEADRAGCERWLNTINFWFQEGMLKPGRPLREIGLVSCRRQAEC